MDGLQGLCPVKIIYILGGQCTQAIWWFLTGKIKIDGTFFYVWYWKISFHFLGFFCPTDLYSQALRQRL